MKYLLLALVLSLNLACAKSVDVAELSDRVDEIESRVSSLESQLRNQILDLQNLSNIILILETAINENEEATDEQLVAIAALEAQAAQQQAEIDELILELAVVQGYSSIVELIDPCGDGPGYDEILLKLSTGQIIAYFQHGNNRHLTVLPNGSYQTTDQQKCNFSVVNGVVQ